MSVYKRGKYWWIRFQHDGKDIRRPAKTTIKRVAEEFERQTREEVGRIARGGKQRRTFDEMMLEFNAKHLPTLAPSSQERYLISTEHMMADFSGKYLDQITISLINKFVSNRQRAGVSSSTIRRDLACLSSAFHSAIGWEWIDTNPVKSLDKRSIKLSPPRRRYLSHGEYDKLLEHASAYLKPMIIFAVYTGLRREEQLSLEWDQVNVQRREVHVPVTKTGTPRTVPLKPVVITAIKSVQHISSPYVFCNGDGVRYQRLTRGLAGAAKRAGIKDLRWHDLRRTCGSWMLQDGVDILRVSRWLGHKSIAVTERHYAFLNIADLHEAAHMSSQEHPHSKEAN